MENRPAADSSRGRDANNCSKRGEDTELIGGRWKLGEWLGEGFFAEVFEAVDNKTGEAVAVKLERIPKAEAPRSELFIESDVYKALNESSNPTGFAQMLFFGRTSDHNAIVMTRLGRPLDDLLDVCGWKFSTKTVLMIGIQAVTRVEQLHDAGYAHVDIHTRNVLIGEKDPDIIYLVDFGSAKELPRSNSSKLRRADMLFLGKLLTTVFCGEMISWFRIMGKEAILDEVRRRCSRHLPEMTQFVEAVYDLEFSGESDYGHLRDILPAGLARRNLTDDRMFDWMESS